MNCQDIQKLLHGYFDGELDLLNHLQIEQHLQECPACAQSYKNLQILKAGLQDDALRFQAPPDLRERLQTALRKTNQPALRETEQAKPAVSVFWQWRWLAVAAAFAGVVILSFIFFMPNQANDDLLAKEMVSAHIRSLMANHLMDVPSSDQHTVKPWFDGKLDFSPPVTDLAAQGFLLVGGRLDYAQSRPIAALVYQRRQHFINLFVFPSPNNPESGSKMAVRQGYNLIHWNKAGMTFWAVSDLNLNELQEFTQIIQN